MELALVQIKRHGVGSVSLYLQRMSSSLSRCLNYLQGSIQRLIMVTDISAMIKGECPRPMALPAIFISLLSLIISTFSIESNNVCSVIEKRGCLCESTTRSKSNCSAIVLCGSSSLSAGDLLGMYGRAHLLAHSFDSLKCLNCLVISNSSAANNFALISARVHGLNGELRL